MADLSRIVSDPGICSGKPRIRGTRIRVGLILGLLQSGTSFDEITAEYPQISRDDIASALAYAGELVDESMAIPRAA